MKNSFISKMNATNIQKTARDTAARVFCGAMLLASGAAHSQEFVDRIKNAKTLDTGSLRQSAQQGANNFGFILQLFGMVAGLIFFCWGILWVMKAQRSEGRTAAGPGWMMLIGGAALGAGTFLYAMFVGAFTGIAS